MASFIPNYGNDEVPPPEGPILSDVPFFHPAIVDSAAKQLPYASTVRELIVWVGNVHMGKKQQFLYTVPGHFAEPILYQRKSSGQIGLSIANGHNLKGGSKLQSGARKILLKCLMFRDAHGKDHDTFNLSVFLKMWNCVG